ncbi:MAG: flavin reductase [Oscillospiraceae bacterium]
MDDSAVFKLSYGVFYLGTELDGKKNICVVNTVAQVTQEPLKISVTVLKSNLTAELINESKKFSVGIMGTKVSLDDVAHFGQQSGRNVDKIAGYDCPDDILGNPLFTNGCIASLCGKVTDTVDLGTHYLFIADLVDATNLSEDKPITYNEYRAMKAGTFKPNAEAREEKRDTWQCTICHYIYDGEIPFEELPDEYICPLCKKPKSAFVKI